MSRTDDLIDLYAQLLAENRRLRRCVIAERGLQHGTVTVAERNAVCAELTPEDLRGE